MDVSASNEGGAMSYDIIGFDGLLIPDPYPMIDFPELDPEQSKQLSTCFWPNLRKDSTHE
jgi:hypothetical protein